MGKGRKGQFMSDDAIKDINLRLDKFYEDTFRDNKTRDDQHKREHAAIMAKVGEVVDQNKGQFQIIEPTAKGFTSVKGFNGVAVWLIKGIIGIAAAVGIIYGFIKYLKS